jgi:hypothetical protein
METEYRLGFDPRGVRKENRGYDMEACVPGTGKLRFIEVKMRASGAKSLIVTKNEILPALNKTDDLILAIGEVASPRQARRRFQREPDFGVTSVNYDLAELLSRSETLA